MIDAAAAVATKNTVIPLLAPIRTPGVLNCPKGLRTEHTVFHSVTNDQNTVIKARVREKEKERGRKRERERERER